MDIPYREGRKVGGLKITHYSLRGAEEDSEGKVKKEDICKGIKEKWSSGNSVVHKRKGSED